MKMNDIAERFKNTTIPAVTIEGYQEGKPIAVNTLVWKIDDILEDLAEQSVEPKAPDFDDDAFDEFDFELPNSIKRRLNGTRIFWPSAMG
jgi:hypothetical protein